MKKVAAVIAVMPPVVPILLIAALALGGPTLAKPPTTINNGYAAALSDMDPVASTAYIAAAAGASQFDPPCVLRPSILAGIGWVESGHGTFANSTPDPITGTVTPPIIGIPLNGENDTLAISDTDNGDLDGDTRWDRAVGPMQFIPQTWAAYGRDGNNDGETDPQNIFDATLAAAAKICADAPAAGTDEEALDRAILAYNRSSTYLAKVKERIAYYDRAFAMIGQFGSFGPRELVQHPNFNACERAYNDILSGELDPRLIAVLSLIVQSHSILTCTIKTGHYQCVGGGNRTLRPDCTESHHFYGRGVDISVVNGQPVGPNNTAAEEIVALVLGFDANDPLRPSGIGSPFAGYAGLRGAFTDEDHQNHIHLGWCGPRYTNSLLIDSCTGTRL